jgi:phage recombination protein Bet
MQQFDQEASKGEVAIFSPPRLPYHPAVTERFGIDKGQWKVLVEAIFPAAKSVDAIVMALSYCKSRNLDVMKRPVHIVPMWDSARGCYVETVWPGISELRTTASRTQGYAGCDVAEFGKIISMDFEGSVKEKGEWKKKTVTVEFPEWCRMTVYRIVGGERCKFVGPKVVWLETYATQGNSELPNKMWSERPEGQLEKCAEAAALRRAFPEEIGNELTAEEMTGRHMHELVVLGDVEPTATTAARDTAPPRQVQEKARDGTPPPREPKKEAPRDAAPPRQAAKPAEPKDDPISTGRATAAMKSANDETKPHRIAGDGHSFESWAARFCDLVKTSKDTADVYSWIDVNTKPFILPNDPDKRKQAGPLERIQKGKPSVYAGIKKVLEETLESLRPKQTAKPAAKPAPKDDMSDAPAEMDDGPTEADTDSVDYGKPADDNPETILKWIEATLSKVDAPEDLENIWTDICQQYTVDLIPPDQDEAAAIYDRHEKRLEP